MTLKQTVKDYLEIEPRFRERAQKDRGIVNMLLKRHQTLKNALGSGLISKEAIIAIVQDYNSLDRLWRKVLEENQQLRGSDYDDKDKLEEQKIVEMGYHTPEHIGRADATLENRQPELL